MITDEYRERLRASLLATIAKRAGPIMSRSCPDYAAYSYECGVIDGLKAAEMSLDEIYREVMGDDRIRPGS